MVPCSSTHTPPPGEVLGSHEEVPPRLALAEREAARAQSDGGRGCEMMLLGCFFFFFFGGGGRVGLCVFHVFSNVFSLFSKRSNVIFYYIRWYLMFVCFCKMAKVVFQGCRVYW